MRPLCLKVDESLHTRLAAAARKRGKSRSQLVRMALEAFLDMLEVAQPGSCHDVAADLAGCVEGPGDLSANKKYMQGFGK